MVKKTSPGRSSREHRRRRLVEAADVAGGRVLQQVGQLAGAHAGGWLLAGGVGLGDEQFVDPLEAGAEAVQQVAGAGVGVRLEEADQAPAGEALNGGGDGGADLGGVVGVIVHDGHAGRVADVLEAALDASKAGDGVAHGLLGQTQHAGDSNSGQSVPHLMNASQTRLEGADRLSAVL